MSKTKKTPAMLATIAAESKTVIEFARRAEAWNAAEARPCTMQELVAAYLPTYQQTTDLSRKTSMYCIERHIRAARETRINRRVKLWDTLTKNLNVGVES